jgi:malectin (di-glucose binding ER protein)/glycosyl hydrolase family 67
MPRKLSALIMLLIGCSSWFGCESVSQILPSSDPKDAQIVIVQPQEASYLESLAAKEIRRYVYQRTGKLLTIVKSSGKLPSVRNLIVVGSKNRSIIRRIYIAGKFYPVVSTLDSQCYMLRTIEEKIGGKKIIIIGGDDLGTLYGTYRFLEHFGIRFYLHGDTIPDEKIALVLPTINDRGQPLFSLRGIQPFHDFPEGPDWWELDDYKAHLAQLPKLRMNFIGFHTYPQGGVGPEPLTWIGLPQDVLPDGKVKFSYPARHFTTHNDTWGYKKTNTSDYSSGAAQLFDRDDYGADYMRGMTPWPKIPEEKNKLFHRMGSHLNDAFTYAHKLGIQTCIGTETPLIIPKELQERIKTLGKDPKDPKVKQELYEGMFRRIAKTHPLDYYWFWTPENWTWHEVKDEQVDATLADFQAAIAAAQNVRAPFTLATCGWVLGPPKDRALFDNFLPKEMPLSCINRSVGFSPVEPGFAKIKNRPQWAIPWMEDDPAMIIPQLWVGRMRQDAADALAYGCTGLMGIHWRTRILGPNVSALAKAAWDQKEWNPNFGKVRVSESRKLKEGRQGGKPANYPNNPIEGTEEDPLYQTVRYDVKAYHFKLPNGSYKITLKFCEVHYNEKNKRVFGVKLQDKTVIDRLDIFANVGKNKVLDYTFEDVEVTNGFVSIDFTYITELPAIAGIVIESNNLMRKINCGGKEYQDYQADLEDISIEMKPRDMPAQDFYDDWAQSQFGPEVAKPVAKMFTKLDGGPQGQIGKPRVSKLPRPSTWVNGPGGIQPDKRNWQEVSREYAFVEKLAALQPVIKGAGNMERFNYWLNQFRFLRAVGKVNCTWAKFNDAMVKVKAQKDKAKQKQLARTTALVIRKELIQDVAEVHKYLLASITTYGGMGNVTNWQQHIMPPLLEKPGKELAQILGQDLPADAMPAKRYEGPTKLIVPTVRTQLETGEDLKLKIIVLAQNPPQQALLYWRIMGQGNYVSTPLEHVARGVYKGTLPAEKIQGQDLEYYVEVKTAKAGTLYFPATAPNLNQTVVTMKSD